jgi:gliding motility-associated-like protein
MLYAFANNSCYDSTNPYGNIVRKVPIAKFDDLPGVCVDGAPKYIKFAYDSSNLTSLLIKSITYSGVGIDTDTLFHPNIAGAGNHQIKVVYETKTPINRPCKDSAYANIRVWALPSVKVDTALVKCEKTGVQFFDKSIADPTTSGIKSWKWNFGDSGKDTIKNPTHIYNNYGTYNITLKVTSDSGCTNTLTPPIRIRVNPNPVASFIPPSGVCVGQASSFTDNSTIADGSESFFNHSWNFGDPTSASNLVSGTHNPTPSHFYSGGATDTIRLVVTSNNGCVDSTKTPVNNAITFPPITPVYKINGVAWDTLKTKSVCLNAPLTFTSAFKANDYRWSFADTVGIINKGATVTHIYPTVKNFVGSFSMIDTNGCQTKAVPIKIAVWGLPNPIIQVSNPTCEKDSIHFTDNTLPVTNTGNISGWLWKFGEPSSGKYDSSKLQYPAHLYATFGSYNIYLTATSDSGCVATNTVATLVNVHPKPKVAITLPTAVCSPNAAVFNDASTIADGSEAQFMHFWNFGEPTSLSNTATGKPLPQASHIYSIAPTDSIRLKISSMDGCIDSIAVKMPANIIHPKPIAAYTVNGLLKDTAKACSNTAINFKDASNVAASVNYWVWGDNGLVVENGSPKAHSYTAAASQYFVGQHYIDDIYGCRSDTTKLLAYIHALPNPAIKIDAPTCEKNDVNFHDNSTASAGTGGLNAWLWNFGDLTTATTTNPTHKYTKAGKYYITLKVTDNSGCTATALVDSVTVHPLPNVRFSVPTSICLPNASATFTDLSTIADGTDTAFVQSWNFGDPSSGTLNNIIGKQKTVVTHIYDSSKLYTIQLTVTSKDGCVDSSKNNIDANIIHPQPIADYIVSSNAKTMDKDTPRVCVYSKIDFKDLSTNVKTSRWNWGDGTFNNGIKASYYQINDPGTYYGSHVITDNFNCTSLPLDFVVVIEKNPTVADGKQFILEGRSELLTPVILDAASVKWTINYPNNSFANYLDADDIETPRCTPLVDSIVYKIEAESEAHCKPNIDHYYTVIRFHTPTIPNAFSPNGDKVNDTWDLSSLTHFTGSTVQVFNRYGQVVLNKFAKSWDGNDMSGNPLPMGTYYYIIKVGLGYPMMSGSVTILR